MPVPGARLRLDSRYLDKRNSADVLSALLDGAQRALTIHDYYAYIRFFTYCFISGYF